MTARNPQENIHNFIDYRHQEKRFLRNTSTSALFRAFFTRLLVTISLVGYAAALHGVYFRLISPAFHYNGETYSSPSTPHYWTSVCLMVILGHMMPSRMNRASDFVLWLTFAMVAAPAMLVPHYARAIHPDQALMLATIVLASFVLVLVIVRFIDLPLRSFKLTQVAYWRAVAGLSVLCLGYMALTGQLSFSTVSLLDVRETRFAYRETLESVGGLLGYIVRLQGNVLGPLLIAGGVIRKKPFVLALGVMGQLAIYSLTAYKTIALSIPAVIIIVLLIKYWPKINWLFVSSGLFISVILSHFIDIILGGMYLVEIFVNRMLIIPGYLTGAHIAVFDGQPKYLWSDSLFAGITGSPYETSSAFLVGQAITASTETTANANIFASGFANAGYPGILFEVFIFALLLVFLNSIARGVPLPLVAGVLLLPVVGLANSGIFAAFLTNGFLYAAILLFLMPRTGWK